MEGKLHPTPGTFRAGSDPSRKPFGAEATLGTSKLPFVTIAARALPVRTTPTPSERTIAPAIRTAKSVAGDRQISLAGRPRDRRGLGLQQSLRDLIQSLGRKSLRKIISPPAVALNFYRKDLRIITLKILTF